MARCSLAIVATLLIVFGRSSGGAGPIGVTIPDIVARGRPPGLRACGSCHLPNGFGRPDTASLAGQPAAYIEAQMTDYRRGARKSLETRAPADAMSGIAVAASDADVRAAAEYFAAIPYAPWIRVVESDSASGVVEVPALDGSGFVASVPAGSINRGETLVTTGGAGRTVRCALCHGDDLRGVGPVPGIAGRSPSYQFRQLRDMQQGARQSLAADLMKPTVERLTEPDMIAIVAYTASLRP